MDKDPAAAEAAIRGRDTDTARLDLLLFLHAFRPEARAEIGALANSLEQRLAGKTDGYMIEVLGPPVPYDGSDDSLLALIELLSSAGVANTHPAFYAIPCAILTRRPGLLAATEPQFGGNRDNFMPRSGCDWGRGTLTDFPDGPVQAFTEGATLADGDFLATHDGTIRFALAAQQQATLQYVRLAPDKLEPAPDGVTDPYQTWSYLSVSNRQRYEHIRPLYRTALTALTRYYQPHFAGQTEALARRALFALVWGADCGGGPPPADHPRTLLFNGSPDAAIRAALLPQGTPTGDDRSRAFTACATKAGIDPLSHLAAALRPALLPDILDTGTVDEANIFGKTPLMAAVQADQLESVVWLLTHGARVTATTQDADDFSHPRHGRRTALHYAAANAGLPIINALLKAGADPDAKDSKGLTPLDYLNGKGPVPPNPRLAGAELDRARALLTQR